MVSIIQISISSIFNSRSAMCCKQPEMAISNISKSICTNLENLQIHFRGL